MHTYARKRRGTRRAGMKKSILFSIAALLLLSAGCYGRSDEDNALRDKLLQSAADGLKQSPAQGMQDPGRGTQSPAPDVQSPSPNAESPGNSPAQTEEETEKMAFVLLGEELSDDKRYATLWFNDVVWVDFEDSELIARYSLEEVFADDNEEYYLYSDDSAWRPVFVMPDGGTNFKVIDWEDDDLPEISISFESFKEILENHFDDDDDYEQNPFLVYYSGEDENGVVLAVREVYLA